MSANYYQAKYGLCDKLAQLVAHHCRTSGLFDPYQAALFANCAVDAFYDSISVSDLEALLASPSKDSDPLGEHMASAAAARLAQEAKRRDNNAKVSRTYQLQPRKK
jgi:hypothetical protein